MILPLFVIVVVGIALAVPVIHALRRASGYHAPKLRSNSIVVRRRTAHTH